MTAQPEVRENVPQHRFEIWIDGELAGHTDYTGTGPVLSFVHTEIDDRFGGHGYGSLLIRAALDGVRARDFQVRPFCPFMKSYVQKHPGYVDLVPSADRPRFGLPETATA